MSDKIPMTVFHKDANNLRSLEELKFDKVRKKSDLCWLWIFLLSFGDKIERFFMFYR